MRHLKFIVSALSILLAGALTAGFAARAVVSPQTGAAVSAGMVSIPSVLGQAADEALFYPWSLYEMQTLSPIPDDALKGLPGDLLFAVAAFGAFDMELSADELIKSQRWNNGENTTLNGSTLVFLKDFPALLADGRVPVSLDYALSDGSPLSASWLVRPRTETELTEGQRQAALDRVREDLADLLRYMCGAGGEYRNDLIQIIENFGGRFSDMNLGIFLGWFEAFINILHMQYNGSLEIMSSDESGQIVEHTFFPDGSELDLPSLSLEELLALGTRYVDIQLISTPRQVVVLFICQAWTFGIYYDVQLERYSGFGLSS